MLRRPHYWSTAFGSFVGGYGVNRLANELARRGPSITSHAIYNWLAGLRTPHPMRATAMVDISAGKLSLEDVYRHREELAKPSRDNGRGDSA